MDEDEDRALLEEWVGRIAALLAEVDHLPGEDPFDFTENAMDSWLKVMSSVGSVPPKSAAALVVVETCLAIAEATSAAVVDYYDTPDARDRMDHVRARRLVVENLEKVLDKSRDWLARKYPPLDEVTRLIAVAADRFNELNESAQKQMATDAEEDAAAAADPYGAVLGYYDPKRDAAIIFTKVCSFTEDEDKRYREAHERLRKMIDSELLQHVSDESDRLCDLVIAVLNDIIEKRIPLSDQDAFDERRRKIRSALISFTSAIHSHREQSVRMARDRFGRKTPELAKVEGLFDDLLKSSFDYGWLNKMRDALLHGDINAFKIELHASLDGESKADVLMDRDYMLKFNKEAREKWLMREELEGLDTDPSVFEMIKSVQPLLSDLQVQLDAVLYPEVEKDVEIVRELIARFEGRQGLHAMQSGPGFTRRVGIPPYNQLAPRVLAYAAAYTTESDMENDSAAE
ncbi:hypothetical protein ACLQ3K_00645 [Tsukamurella sp. DT100]|uniref:hypothetical protein n=1 Tax=Tsukamurella sp. DT100 TaxID=3393415 RepID=UPI003CFAAEB8